jgi:hypothetical protein
VQIPNGRQAWAHLDRHRREWYDFPIHGAATTLTYAVGFSARRSSVTTTTGSDTMLASTIIVMGWAPF